MVMGIYHVVRMPGVYGVEPTASIIKENDYSRNY